MNKSSCNNVQTLAAKLTFYGSLIELIRRTNFKNRSTTNMPRLCLSCKDLLFEKLNFFYFEILSLVIIEIKIYKLIIIYTVQC